MDTELLLIIVFAFGCFLGFWVSARLAQNAFINLLEELNVSESALRDLARKNGLAVDEPAEETESINIVIERHGNQLYAFRKDTDEFIGQGQDREALVSRIAERFNNVKFTVAQDEGAEFLKDPAT